MIIHFSLASVVVNYRTDNRTIEMVTEELSKCTLSQLIVVVNNGGTEESTAYLALSLKASIVRDVFQVDIVHNERNTYVIHNPDNSGFARGNNLGVTFVETHFDVDYLLFPNNDIRLQSDDVIERLINKLEMLPDVGIIGPRVVGVDGHCQSPNDYVSFWKELVGTPWERFIPCLHLDHIDQDVAEEGYYYRVMGSFFVMRLRDFIQCGRMDVATFLYYEEAILAERLLLIEKRVYYYPEVSVLHEHGYSVNRAKKQLNNRDYMFESAVYFYQKYKGVNYSSVWIASVLHTVYQWLQNSKRSIWNK